MQLKLKKLAIMLLVMFTLVGSITAIMTAVNTTPTQGFLNAWGSSFVFAVLVLLPLGSVIFTTVTKLINHFFVARSSAQKKLLQAMFMAFIMESIMAIISTLNSHSYESFYQFYHVFFRSLIFALPVGVTISCLMVFFIKPKLDKHLTNVTA